MALKSLNSANEKIIKSFTAFTQDEVNSIISDVNEEYEKWKYETYENGKTLMLKAAHILRTDKEKYGKIITSEMGKPLTKAIAEVEKCAWVCEYYAENAESILQNEYIKTDASESYVQIDPIGIVLAVMPCNFPFWQVFRFAAPDLMAGNA